MPTGADRLASSAVLLAALGFALSPLFTGGFGGYDPAQFPVPQVNAPIQPAGYAFSIWGVIYLWLVIHAAAGVLQRADDPSWHPMRWPLALSLALGASWIAVAKVSPVFATLQIWLMLATALLALFRSPAEDRWLAQAPVALYAGWLTAASFVSLGLVGAGNGIGPGGTGWGYLALAAALGFAAAVQVTLNRAPFYGLGVAWALIGIAVANWQSAPGMVGAALIATGAMAALAIRAAR